MSKHVQNICKSCVVQLRDFRHVRWFLTHDASVLVANALVLVGWITVTHFSGVSQFNLCKLQCIQNSAARIISNTSRYTSITPVLKKLHWLPVEHRSVFKTATLVYKFLHTGFPKYCAPYTSLPTTVPTVPGTVRVVVISLSFPSFNPQSINPSQFGYSFAFDAPTVWNALPEEIRVSPLWPPLENASKPTFTPRHTLLSLTYPLAFSVVLGLFSVPGF